MGERFEMQHRQNGCQLTAEAVKGTAGARRRSIRTRTLHYRVKSCSYTNTRKNKITERITGSQSKEHIKQPLHVVLLEKLN